jgi:hypothetical protein
MFKTMSAVAAAAFAAAAITFFPSLSPQVAASTPVPVVKGDRLDLGARSDCRENPWPYYERACLPRDASQSGRAVRIITVDRISTR